MADETLLVISAIGVPPYSARGLSMSYQPIGEAVNLQRTVNGAFLDLSPPQMKKLALKISCNDQQNPALDGVFPGLEVTVDCVFELAYLTSGGSPAKSVVSGSSRTEGDFTFYRPQLTCTITAYDVSQDEYGATVGWNMSLEES